MNNIARCYIRVSFTRAGETKESPDTQKAQIRAWCERYGYTPEWYFDSEGYQSGRTAKRDAYQRLIQDIETEPTAAVVFWKVSRLARNNELSQRLYRTCKERHLHLAFVANSLEFDFNRDDPFTLAMAKLLFDILASVAEFVSAEISANVRANIQTRQKKGKHWGTIPAGTLRTEDGILVPDPESIAGLRRCYELYATNEHGAGTIAAMLNEEGYKCRWNGRDELEEWSDSRVRSAVQRWRTYAGHVVGGDARDDNVDIIVRDAWAPILDLDLIHRVRDVYQMRSYSQYRPPREYLLSTFLICVECGSPLYGAEGVYYSHYERRCDHGRSIYIEEADETIAEIVTNLDYEQVATQVEARVSELVRPSPPESSPALERLRELEEQHAGLLELAGRMESDRLYEKIVAVEQEMEQIEAKLTPEAPAPVMTMAVDELLAIPDWYEAGSVAERREVLAILVDEIEAHCIERWVEVKFREDWHEYFGESIRRDLPSRRPPTAEAVLKLRAATGWKQRDLAEQLGLSRKTVSRYERGLNCPNPEYSERLRRLAEKVAPEVAEAF